MIIKIRNGMERSRLMITLMTCMSQRGRGSTPPFSPRHQQHAQRQAQHKGQGRADHGDVERLPNGLGQRGQHRQQMPLHRLGGEYVVIHDAPPPLPCTLATLLIKASALSN